MTRASTAVTRCADEFVILGPWRSISRALHMQLAAGTQYYRAKNVRRVEKDATMGLVSRAEELQGGSAQAPPRPRARYCLGPNVQLIGDRFVRLRRSTT